MNIIQFEDKPLAHYSYAIISGDEMALVDPARDSKPYYQLAEKHNVKIKAVFETHPHADFVSSHLQIHKETGATVYVSKLVGANYPHNSFDDGDTLKLGEVTFSAINTPGHSPDSITIIAKNKEDYAMFSGDTLFIGDVGRPDLREKAGNMKAKREELAKNMYQTIQSKFNELPDHTVVYPAHGAGSLCGKNMSTDASSTLGRERKENWAFKNLSEDQFVNHILADQPFIPSYFGYNVDINKSGADNLERSIAKAEFHLKANNIKEEALVIDVRGEEAFKRNHISGSINIMAQTEDDKLETWLGSIIKPEEKFFVVLNSVDDRDEILHRIAKIGYEKQVIGSLTIDDASFETSETLNLEDFKKHPSHYTIVDIRNRSELAEEQFFENAKPHPLNELRDTVSNIPKDKPIVVHCAGGYRSAAGASIIQKALEGTKVYDLSTAVEQFK
ncbi:MBL fold metallo-hydrolase [Winogradskyella litoriviva]|uniref:MBL fold metallo-hydrolase n=1 Tax=Winogradskyella litoriviva TaxID=1220182 RepID=A0ABX2E308_9FLAO|nr:MBL fold metallo-hydrolase [Winogradskyella litoriviva]NRD22629.1 MBL fold metallo-hydrolase [Winogradskyella litoriviva]